MKTLIGCTTKDKISLLWCVCGSHEKTSDSDGDTCFEMAHKDGSNVKALKDKEGLMP